MRFQSAALSELYCQAQPFCHPEYPFLDPAYSPGGYYPFTDFTSYVASWLKCGDYESIRELWSYLTANGPGEKYLLEKCLRTSIPRELGLDPETEFEARAIHILCSRQSLYDNSINGVVYQLSRLFASRLSCISWVPPLEVRDILHDGAAKEAIVEEGRGVRQRRREQADFAMATLLEPISEQVALAGQWLIQIPPITRLVIVDYFTRSWSEGRLRPQLYYGDRCYGCSTGWNLHFIDWMGCFDHPNDEAKIPHAINKSIVQEALAGAGVPFKKSATKEELNLLAREQPGMVSTLFKLHAPEIRTPKAEWKDPLQFWSIRANKINCVATAILKTLAAQSLRN